MQRRHSGAHADQLPHELQVNSPRASMPRKNSMPAGESSRSSDHRGSGGSGGPSSSSSVAGGGGDKGFNRWTLVLLSALLAFFVLSELRYQRGCDVSESFSRQTSRIGGVTLTVLDQVNVTHWLAFGSLMEALLLANAKGDADTLLAAQAAAAAAARSIARKPQPLEVDFHVSPVQVAVDMTTMHDDAFWSVVTELEANHLHVSFDEARRMMHIYDRDDSFDPTALPNKYIPSWFVSEPYHVGKPHATVWFVHLDAATATYSVKQGAAAKGNRRRVFAEADITPLKHLTFLGRAVPVPTNIQKVVAQEFAQELNDGIATKRRAQCLREFVRGDAFYDAEGARWGWIAVFVLATLGVYHGVLRRWCRQVAPSPASKQRSLTDTDHKVFV